MKTMARNNEDMKSEQRSMKRIIMRLVRQKSGDCQCVRGTRQSLPESRSIQDTINYPCVVPINSVEDFKIFNIFLEQAANFDFYVSFLIISLNNIC